MFSIIIPVYNKWDLTRECLVSLAATIRDENFEILLVDNASTDDTHEACPLLGKKLFGERFTYLPQEQNRNFAGANNIGASLAKGDFLFLLNNDTLAQEGWHENVLAAFTDPSIGAAGPLLLYPPDKQGIERVQHLGVTVSLGRQVSHLYEHFPVDHPVVKRQRFFQIITAAAFCIPRQRYLALGGLDEGFINGFEDVEFCARLCRAGYRQTVVPSSRMIHLGSQSEGRGRHEIENSRRCAEQTADIFRFDEASFWREDGYVPIISKWLSLETEIPAEQKNSLDLCKKSVQAWDRMVHREPLWIDGALDLATHYEQEGNLQAALNIFIQAGKFCATPRTLLPLHAFLSRHGNRDGAMLEMLKDFVITREQRKSHLRAIHHELQASGETELSQQAEELLSTNEMFFNSSTYCELENLIK